MTPVGFLLRIEFFWTFPYPACNFSITFRSFEELSLNFRSTLHWAGARSRAGRHMCGPGSAGQRGLISWLWRSVQIRAQNCSCQYLAENASVLFMANQQWIVYNTFPQAWAPFTFMFQCLTDQVKQINCLCPVKTQWQGLWWRRWCQTKAATLSRLVGIRYMSHANFFPQHVTYAPVYYVFALINHPCVCVYHTFLLLCRQKKWCIYMWPKNR